MVARRGLQWPRQLYTQRWGIAGLQRCPIELPGPWGATRAPSCPLWWLGGNRRSTPSCCSLMEGRSGLGKGCMRRRSYSIASRRSLRRPGRRQWRPPWYGWSSYFARLERKTEPAAGARIATCGQLWASICAHCGHPIEGKAYTLPCRSKGHRQCLFMHMTFCEECEKVLGALVRSQRSNKPTA